MRLDQQRPGISGEPAEIQHVRAVRDQQPVCVLRFQTAPDRLDSLSMDLVHGRLQRLQDVRRSSNQTKGGDSRLLPFALSVNPGLPGDNPWSEEKQQLGGSVADVVAAEQVADQRKAPDEGNLRNIGLLVRDNDSTDHHSAAVNGKHFGFHRLRVQGRNSLDAGYAVVNLRVLDEYVHEDCAIGGNLRRDFQLQHRIHILHRDGVVYDRLNGNLHALFDGVFFIVLRDDLGLREQFADTL